MISVGVVGIWLSLLASNSGSGDVVDKGLSPVAKLKRVLSSFLRGVGEAPGKGSIICLSMNIRQPEKVADIVETALRLCKGWMLNLSASAPSAGLWLGDSRLGFVPSLLKPRMR